MARRSHGGGRSQWRIHGPGRVAPSFGGHEEGHSKISMTGLRSRPVRDGTALGSTRFSKRGHWACKPCEVVMEAQEQIFRGGAACADATEARRVVSVVLGGTGMACTCRSTSASIVDAHVANRHLRMHNRRVGSTLWLRPLKPQPSGPLEGVHTGFRRSSGTLPATRSERHPAREETRVERRFGWGVVDRHLRKFPKNLTILGKVFLVRTKNRVPCPKTRNHKPSTAYWG